VLNHVIAFGRAAPGRPRIGLNRARSAAAGAGSSAWISLPETADELCEVVGASACGGRRLHPQTPAKDVSGDGATLRRYDFNGGGLSKTDDMPAFLVPVRQKAASFAGVRQRISSRSSKRLQPKLATLTDAPFDDPDWVFETKWDVVRMIADIAGGQITLYSRNGKIISDSYRDVAKALEGVKSDAVLDGELVAGHHACCEF